MGESKRCAWPVHECIDDMCRNSVERGLCGKWVEPDEDRGDDGYDDEWDDIPLESWEGA